MSLKRKFVIVIFFFSFQFIFSQNIIQQTFDKFQFITVYKGEEFISGNGTNCKLKYNPNSEIYSLEYLDSSGSIIYQIFKVVEKHDEEIFVEFFNDDSPNKLKYKVIDKINSNGALMFESVSNPNLGINTKVTFKYSNEN